MTRLPFMTQRQRPTGRTAISAVARILLLNCCDSSVTVQSRRRRPKPAACLSLPANERRAAEGTSRRLGRLRTNGQRNGSEIRQVYVIDRCRSCPPDSPVGSSDIRWLDCLQEGQEGGRARGAGWMGEGDEGRMTAVLHCRLKLYASIIVVADPTD